MKSVKIREYVICEGKPLICLPLTADHMSALFKETQEAVTANHAQMVEWRVDLYRPEELMNDLEEILHGLKKRIGSMLLLVTIRTVAEGGRFNGNSEAYVSLYHRIIQTGAADLIDIELSQGNTVMQGLNRAAHEQGCHTIASCHYFTHTPALKEMCTCINNLSSSGADIAKLAVMPKEPMDVLYLLQASAQMKACLRTPLISMSMGVMGCVSRLCGEIFGSCVTFAVQANESAPGQMKLAVVAPVIEAIHEGIVKQQTEKNL